MGALFTHNENFFELKVTDLGGRIGNLRTKTSIIETPALLPVIHPSRQLVPCQEIKSMGYEAVMTNAYTTMRRLCDRASEGIHRLIDFDGTIMTDSGGYQVLEYGAIDIQPEEMARFEERIRSDIAIILDKPTGLDVSKKFASLTVNETLKAAESTRKILSQDSGMLWALPIQGGKYLDLVKKSSKFSSKLGYDCFALGSPVEVMEEYDFDLLVKMIVTSKKYLPQNRPFHLFGAGHPLILPLAVSLGCDMFDSASYMLYAKQGRYISSTGTVRLDQLEFLGCTCKICSSIKAKELKSLKEPERTVALAKHNLSMLKSVIEETKQAIWEGRLWEYIQASVRNHPKALEAFRTAVALGVGDSSIYEEGTPAFKDRGIFNFESIDLRRPEIVRYREKISQIDMNKRSTLLILPETKTKPFLKSKIFDEISKIASGQMNSVLVAILCPNFGLVPSELSDIFPLSQYTNAYQEFPIRDYILFTGNWAHIVVLFPQKDSAYARWIRTELAEYLKIPVEKLKINSTRLKGHRFNTDVRIAHSYRNFKNEAKKVMTA